ncbi:MAG: M23 family metallopeptidase, partial [Odoribacter sp.]|nr:M23 family metallopeptidase [Odoribacter sp.]
YMHLSRFAKGIKVGSTVKQKEVIGYVGATGVATGPHLDFRVYENGKPINPLTIKSQPKKPVSEDNMSRFVVVRDSVIRMLDRISCLFPEEEETAMEMMFGQYNLERLSR